MTKVCAALLLGFTLLLPACSDDEDGQTDGGAEGDGAIHDLSMIEISGRVTVGRTAPASNTVVSAYCGGARVDATTDDDGEYSVTADVKGCEPLVVEIRKESFLPVIKVLPLPPPTSPVTLDIQLEELDEILCTPEICPVEGSVGSSFPPVPPLVRGWVTSGGGENALRAVGGEFRDTEDNLIWVIGFGYFDFRDADGAIITELTPFTECFNVKNDTFDWLFDADSETTDVIELTVFQLDEGVGRWRREPDAGWVGHDTEPGEVFDAEPIPVSSLADVRAGEHEGPVDRRIWACFQVHGSGWYAWGVSIAQKSCFTLLATNECDEPLPNTVFRLTGRDHGYLAQTWTDNNGEACLEVARSEDVGAHYDSDEFGGETFFLDAEMIWDRRSEDVKALESPRAPGTCDMPETCEPRTVMYNNTRCD